MDKLNIFRWSMAFEEGYFKKKENPKEDVRTQIEAGWFDWFCKDSSLAGKTAKLGRIIKQIKYGGKVKVHSWYVWFKNNCPLRGPLYDDFRFADIETGEVQFTIQVNCCWRTHRFTVYGRTPDGVFHEEPLFETDSSIELVNWFNTAW